MMLVSTRVYNGVQWCTVYTCICMCTCTRVYIVYLYCSLCIARVVHAPIPYQVRIIY